MKIACATLASLATLLLASSPASAYSHHVTQHHHAHHHSWPLTTHYPEWPKSTFYGPRWTGDAQPWWKSDEPRTTPDRSFSPRPMNYTPREQRFAERHERMAQPALYATGGYGPRPHAWCGWFMRTVKGVQDAALNLAANWAHWGRATDAHPGAVAVWRHHVGEVASGACPPGAIMLHSGNDGHTVRTRCVPLRGIIAFREA